MSFVVFLTGSSSACSRPARHDQLIDLYRDATCIPAGLSSDMPPMRTWDFKTRTHDGTDVHIVGGGGGPSGRVLVQFGSDRPTTAAHNGDYFVPADLRISAGNDRLYVKMTGVPASRRASQTWLFDFDLRQRKELRRLLVDQNALPPECK